MTNRFSVFAELLKEQKRKDNAEKAKKKLASYHNKVKTEAEKIQVWYYCVFATNLSALHLPHLMYGSISDAVAVYPCWY